jgi:hypothetical protein
VIGRDLNFTWIVPVAESESDDSVETCLCALKKVLCAGDQLVLVIFEKHRLMAKRILHDCPFECTFVRHPTIRTPGAARNAGLIKAKYLKVIFQDSDDVPSIDRRRYTDEALVEPGTILSAGYNVVADGSFSGTRFPYSKQNFFYFRTNIFLPSAAVFFRSQIRFFSEDHSLGEDTLFFASLLNDGYKVKFLHRPLIDYNLISSKVITKRGIIGVSRELQFRRALLRLAPTFQCKFMVITGGALSLFIKLLPSFVFVSIYRSFHRSE